MKNFTNRPAGVLAAALLCSLASLSLPTAVQAAPPGGGIPAGTIYYTPGGGGIQTLYSMKSDGSNKTLLAAGPGSPSRLLHGGQRWFVRRLDVPGDPFYFGPVRRDLFAVRQDGAMTIRLTDDPGMEWWIVKNNNSAEWAPDENASAATLSAACRRRYQDGVVVPGSAGLYTAVLRFDAAGAVIGLDAPFAYRVSLGIVGNEIPDNANPPSWSPDMSKVVLDHNEMYGDLHELRTIDVATGVPTTLLRDPARTLLQPTWSPDGSKISFVSNGAGIYYIETIAPGGSGRTIVVSDRKNYLYYAFWSPDSAYLIFHVSSGSWPSDILDIYRISVLGSGKLYLTGDIPNVYALAWR